MKPPFFIIGAPRSGTTFLQSVLDRHPEIFITNETRVMTFASRTLNGLTTENWALGRHRESFLAHLHEAFPRIIVDFYRSLGATEAVRWGDKHPHYADAKRDPKCLDLIDAMFPESQFVHLVRDGRDVVCSVVRKGWEDFEGAIDVWRRHVTHARAFGDRVGPGRYLEVRYEDLYREGQAEVGRVLAFLGLAEDAGVTGYLLKQEARRKPVSSPVSDITDVGEAAWKSEFDATQIERMHRDLGDLLLRYRYLSPTAP